MVTATKQLTTNSINLSGPKPAPAPAQQWRCVCICGLVHTGELIEKCNGCAGTRFVTRLLDEDKPRRFDSIRDETLIVKGTHFFCHACLQAVPLNNQSTDIRHCQSCQATIAAEKRAAINTRDFWDAHKAIFHHYGQSWAVQVAEGKVRHVKTPGNGTEQAQADLEPVSKFATVSQQGKHPGRPKFKASDEKILRDNSLTLRERAKLLGCGKDTVRRLL